nr:Os04g0597816 [Ipomoea trifida]
MMRKRMGRKGNEEGRMWKDLMMFKSIVEPCWIEKVWSWARQTVIITVHKNTGMRLTKIFAFSTCVTLQTLQGFGSSSQDVWIAALTTGRLKLKVSWYLNNLGNGTTSLNNINTIKWQAKSEEDSTKEHSHRRSSKAPVPSLMLDKPNEEREAHRPSYTNAQQQPVEEARHLGSLFRVFVVELVRPVRRHRGFHPRGSDRYRVQRHE